MIFITSHELQSTDIWFTYQTTNTSYILFATLIYDLIWGLNCMLRNWLILNNKGISIMLILGLVWLLIVLLRINFVNDFGPIFRFHFNDFSFNRCLILILCNLLISLVIIGLKQAWVIRIILLSINRKLVWGIGLVKSLIRNMIHVFVRLIRCWVIVRAVISSVIWILLITIIFILDWGWKEIICFWS